jgi:hypothetical protein
MKTLFSFLVMALLFTASPSFAKPSLKTIYCTSRVLIFITDAKKDLTEHFLAGPELEAKITEEDTFAFSSKVDGHPELHYAIAYSRDHGDKVYLGITVGTQGAHVGIHGRVGNGKTFDGEVFNNKIDKSDLPSRCDVSSFKVTCADNKATAESVANDGTKPETTPIPPGCFPIAP